MKKKSIITVSLAIIMVFALTACLFSKMRTYTEGPVTDTIKNHGKEIEVTVDLRDGWSCEFSNATIYMYNTEKQDNASFAGLVMWMEDDIYEEDIENGKEYDSFTEENGVTSYTDENGDQYRVVKVNDEVPIVMQIYSNIDADDFYKRITFGEIK